MPVIRDADQLSIHGLNVAIADVAARAKAGKFQVDDFGGGTFTVDNTGYLGTNLVMPILNVPEVGIVTMEAITKRPVVVSTPDGDVIAIRPIMNMVLGVDHRANDGAGGAALLRDIKALARGGRAGHADLLTRPAREASSITGGAGFIGGAVTRQLLARGDEVVALVRDRTGRAAIDEDRRGGRRGRPVRRRHA